IANMNTGNSMNLAEAKDLAEDYLDAADIDYELHYLGFWEGLFVPDKAGWARTGITAGNPVYIAISGTDTTIVNDEIHHAVVGYRYDDDSIIAHSGWRNMTINDGSPRTAIHINGYTVNEAFYSSLQHKAYCSCGNYVLRAHLGLAQAPGMPIYCASCGYEMDDGE